MRTFREWLVLKEAMGTLKGKATGQGNVVSNRSQFWGPAAFFGHDVEKVQPTWKKAAAALPSAVGSIFIDKLGYTPEQLPHIMDPPEPLVTKTHVQLDGTLPLQVLFVPSMECDLCLDDEENSTECMWEKCHVDYETMDAAVANPTEITKELLQNPYGMRPNPADKKMLDAGHEFTQALIMRDMWEALSRKKQTQVVDFDSPKIEKRVHDGYLTIVALFPRTDVKGPKEYT
jgi:hypothetical protein